MKRCKFSRRAPQISSMAMFRHKIRLGLLSQFYLAEANIIGTEKAMSPMRLMVRSPLY